MIAVSGARVEGPLEEFAVGFAGELARLGYTPLSARLQVALAGHLSRWLAGRGLGAGALTQAVVREFLAARRAAGYTAYLAPEGLCPLLGYLRDLGVAPPPAAPAARSAAEVLLERYRAHLVGERGLGAATAAGYVGAVRPFVAARLGAHGAGLGDLAGADVAAFVLEVCRTRPPKAAQYAATALRSLLRFLHYDGVVPVPLAAAVPKVADRREGLPRFLEPGEVARLLASCDRAGAAGRRDFAMITVMVRLGLRRGEVAALTLDDVDWRRGEVAVRGKGPRTERLPLPADVGQAVADYLAGGRPRGALDRCVFTRVKAPQQGLTGAGVGQAVAAAGRRAGLGRVGAHRLRHSAATTMLRAGTPLAEVGQVLRHRRALTTATYAKVDHGALGTLARPWPAGGAL